MMNKVGLFLGLLLTTTLAWGMPDSGEALLRVYGPGGPYHVIQECATRFAERQGIEIVVIRALPGELERRLASDGDIYYGGAEYMLDEVRRQNPDLLDMTTATNLHPRRIGVVVRKGNPLGIYRPEDLRRDGIDLLDVKLERMRPFHTSADGRSGHIRSFAFTGRQGLEAWLDRPDIDAWITYRSWHRQLGDQADFIPIPGPAGLRYTPVALTRHTPKRQAALKFIAYLQSDEARQIFRRHGWY